MKKKRNRTGLLVRSVQEPEPVRPGRLLKVGDKVTRVPETFRDLDSKGRVQSRAMTGVVCWVHPKGRFHMVEFPTPGGPVRESFAGVRE